MHVMLDLETFGTQPGCVIRSIGACVFDPHGDGYRQSFYFNIDHQSCVDAWLTVNPDTEKWWNKQSIEAQNALLVDPKPLLTVATAFREWWFAVKAVKVWAQGSNFDPALWEEASRRVGVKIPWQLWNTRDTRTVYDVNDFNDKSLSRNGTYHNALDDCIHQVRCVQTALRKGR